MPIPDDIKETWDNTVLSGSYLQTPTIFNVQCSPRADLRIGEFFTLNDFVPT